MINELNFSIRDSDGEYIPCVLTNKYKVVYRDRNPTFYIGVLYDYDDTMKAFEKKHPDMVCSKIEKFVNCEYFRVMYTK
jgi:hypothetical protein